MAGPDIGDGEGDLSAATDRASLSIGKDIVHIHGRGLPEAPGRKEPFVALRFCCRALGDAGGADRGTKVERSPTVKMKCS